MSALGQRIERSAASRWPCGGKLPIMARACLTFEVEDIEQALDELKRKGVKLIDKQPRIGHASSRIASINPKSTGNVLIELVELASPGDPSVP
jgi:hypothetical protein